MKPGGKQRKAEGEYGPERQLYEEKREETTASPDARTVYLKYPIAW